MILALNGKRRSGKDTAAAALQRERGVIPLKIVGRMKQIVRECFLLTDDHIEGSLKEVPLNDLHRRTDVAGVTYMEDYIVNHLFRHAVAQMNGGYDVTPRDFMIWAGNLGRPTSLPPFTELDPLYWLQRQLRIHNFDANDYVITDLSFQAEFDYLGKQPGVFPARINRPSDLRGSDGQDAREVELDDETRWFSVYDNVGTEEDLAQWVISVFDEAKDTPIALPWLRGPS